MRGHTPGGGRSGLPATSITGFHQNVKHRLQKDASKATLRTKTKLNPEGMYEKIEELKTAQIKKSEIPHRARTPFP